MVVIIKVFKGATHVDKFGRMFKAKTTCVIKQTPQRESYMLTNGMVVSKQTCLEPIRKK